jgi:hypothetical protein
MEFDFRALAFALAAVSLGGSGAILAGAFLFREWAAREMKDTLPMVIIGLVLVGVSGVILSSLGAGGGTPLAGPAMNWVGPMLQAPVPSLLAIPAIAV